LHEQLESFISNGYIVIKECISKDVMDQCQRLLNDALSTDPLQNNFCDEYSRFRSLIEYHERSYCKTGSESGNEYYAFDVMKPLWNSLVGSGVLENILNEKSFISLIKEMLGPDLAFQDMPTLILNLPSKPSSNANYQFKEWHQEVWSGASISTVQTWSPIFMDKSVGGISVIPGSHNWGHIPHRNRVPVDLPDEYQSINIEAKVGDVVVFHSLLLHKTNPVDADFGSRLALTVPLRNFKANFDSFEQYSNWKIYHRGVLSRIDKRLGNHYLSPYRVDDNVSKNLNRIK
jgi:hypothetical protein